MRFDSLQPLLRYALIILGIVILTGIVIGQFMSNYVVLFLVLLTEYILLMSMLHYVFDKYVKPIKKATSTLDELVKGNFSARMHHPVTGSMADLLMKINKLARSLSELSLNEKIQAEQLTTVIENIQSGLVLIDERGYIHLVNKNFLSIFGGTEQDYIGYLYYDILDNEKIHKMFQQTFLYEQNIKDSIMIERDSKQYFEIVGAPIFDDRNLLKGAVLVLYEITELKKLETMRKDFVANVSHELKTPITSIRGFSETLLDDDLNDKEIAKHFLRIMNEESKRLQALISDLLTLSRLEKENSRVELSHIQMKKLIDEVVPVLKEKATRHGVSLVTDIEQDLHFYADQNGVKQILINIVGNAIDYTPQDGEVLLLAEQQQNNIHLMVRDTGIGIPQEALPRIFERFYRVDKARSRNTGGTGLGLAIVKHIVELHKGNIQIHSEVNVGTTIDIYIPIIEEEGGTKLKRR